MAVFKFNRAIPGVEFPLPDDFAEILDMDVTSVSPTLVRFEDEDVSVSFKGKAFESTMTSNGSLLVLGGTITGMTVDDGIGRALTVTKLNLSAPKFADLLSNGSGNAAVAYLLKGNDKILGTNGADLLMGFAGKDMLSGGLGDDALYGGAGNDQIYGGRGNDALYGGAGKDSFVFDTKLGKNNVDHLADFDAPKDKIMLDHDIFTKAGADGALRAGRYVEGDHALDRTDRIIYDQDSGSIFYDKDGSGAAKQVLFATVAAGTDLSVADFFLF